MRTRALKLLVMLLTLCCASVADAAKMKVKSLCDIYYPSDTRIPWECVELQEGDTPNMIFGRYWRDGLHFNRMDRRHFGAGVSVKVPLKMEQLRGFTPLPATYPSAAREAKFILVDQTEGYLGAYENGKLVFSTPVAVGIEGYPTPTGTFQVDAANRTHSSNLYPVEGTDRPYPMHYALRFFQDKREERWPAYWIHGRDVPGYPDSHGCVGLYDEEMQKEYFKSPRKPLLKDAKWLYQWVTGERAKVKSFQKVENGPKVQIVGTPPGVKVTPGGRPVGAPGP
ncbi:L,D-transpeptidase family protein [Geomonas sp. RF6]|uniref:L,D-transpeptidase n=1 Tax=Geomonas sp. RF6 TaxID=2897342 RepID=UPI001E63A7A5|nr:L,D-transpeptidase [Geomonas sp. RF6]UFS69435.1 L,D-transpeptidase family protein [Geomonas sp. RF6]